MSGVWIKIESAKPPLHTPVYVYGWHMLGAASPSGPYKRWIATVGEFDGYECKDLLNAGCDCVAGNPLHGLTHWMPLPEPPTPSQG